MLQVTECNVPLSKWQSEGHDPGTTAAPYPPDIDDIILSLGKEKLALP